MTIISGVSVCTRVGLLCRFTNDPGSHKGSFTYGYKHTHKTVPAAWVALFPTSGGVCY